MYKYLLSIFACFFFVACSTAVPHRSQTSVETLSQLLQTLDTGIPSEEARQLSNEIFQETHRLGKKYDPVFEPHINNFLINAGIKEKGLCYEWSDALYLHFRHSHYPHFEFHLLVADQGEYFSEHNVLVVTAKDGDVMDGIIIDPWRSPGEVYFSKVLKDTKYKWKHRKEREIL